VNAPRPGVARAAQRHALLATAFCALVVAMLGIGVLTDFGPQMNVDGAVSEAVYAGDDRTPFTNGLLEVLTAPGLSTVRVALFLPVLAFLLLRRRFLTALWVGIVVLTAGPLNGALKAFFGRVRPDFDQGGARYDSLSYPSGHATGIAVLVTVTLLLL
jgi:undecaprenyl-diphosphatase